ncbi:uncharacterized protein LOC111633911 [Centruroides sculpturatus]|uniref:uncharacterized protein LOC111633911 n=1 Tax=Centruroides sculpturatus TaxID=218467 RepID=UPI000C6C934A|nr:uncharacterized protein LOC111633911 [Centruroides sculpturatus]
MLGHLYARPPSAEIKTELPVSGIHNTSSQTIRNPSLVSSPPLISGNKLLRVKTNSVTKEISNSGKLSDANNRQCTRSSPETLTSFDPCVKVIFLLSNTISLLQPMNQGVIKTFKAYYTR